MKRNYYPTETYDKHHLHFGGKIYPSDFSTDYRGKDYTNGSAIAARIAYDLQWEKNTLSQNRKNIQGDK